MILEGPAKRQIGSTRMRFLSSRSIPHLPPFGRASDPGTWREGP